MNKNEIKKIIEELYAMDPSLRSRERELTALIESLALKPRVERDQVFFSDLRARLLVELSRPREKKITLSMILMKHMKYIGAGIAVLAVAVLGVVQFSSNNKTTSNNSLMSVNITKVGDHAFGSLNTLSAQSSATQNTNAAAPTEATAGNSAASPTAPRMMAPTATNGVSTNAAVMMSPIVTPPQVTYVYKGDTFTQDQTQVDVLKKTPGGLSVADVTSALGQSGSSLIDMSSFPGSQVTNLTFTQNQALGYVTNIDFVAGEISISMNWSEWPQTTNDSPLTAADMPATSTVFAIANQFLTDHHIPTTNYGDPEVINNNYTFAVPLAMEGSAGSNGAMIPYYPDSIQVLYPLMVNGKTVYNSSGSKIGLTVEVNIRQQKVENVYGLDTQIYQASSYAAIADVNKLISLAENPQSNVIYYSGVKIDGTSDVTTPTKDASVITLGTPQQAYVQMYQYDNTTGVNSEFLVPALVFPVTDRSASAANLYNNTNAVVVPLVQDFIQDNAPVHILNTTTATPPVPTAIPATATQ